MKILFVFGGALTAHQSAVVDKASLGDQVTVSNHIGEHEYDLLVFGSGVRLPKGVDGVPFCDYAKEKEVEKVKKKAYLEKVDDCCKL